VRLRASALCGLVTGSAEPSGKGLVSRLCRRPMRTPPPQLTAATAGTADRRSWRLPGPPGAACGASEQPDWLVALLDGWPPHHRGR
jgi:hypothetical protein